MMKCENSECLTLSYKTEKNHIKVRRDTWVNPGRQQDNSRCRTNLSTANVQEQVTGLGGTTGGCEAWLCPPLPLFDHTNPSGASENKRNSLKISPIVTVLVRKANHNQMFRAQLTALSWPTSQQKLTGSQSWWHTKLWLQLVSNSSG